MSCAPRASHRSRAERAQRVKSIFARLGNVLGALRFALLRFGLLRSALVRFVMLGFACPSLCFASFRLAYLMIFSNIESALLGFRFVLLPFVSLCSA